MLDKLKKLLEGGVAQANIFDGGKTFQSVVNNRTPQQQNAVQQQQAQARTFRPSQPSVAPQQTFTNKLRDILDANTEADKFRRAQVNKPLMYEDQQAQARQQASVGSKIVRPEVQTTGLDNINKFSSSFNERYIGGIGRGLVRAGEWLTPGDQTASADRLVNTFFPEAGSNAAQNGLARLADKNSAGGKLGTFGKGVFDTVTIAVPSTSVSKAAQGTQLISNLSKGGNVAKVAAKVLPELAASPIGSLGYSLQERGRGNKPDIAKEVGIGAGLDLAMPLALEGLSRVAKPVIGAASDALGRIKPRSVAEIADEVNIARTAPQMPRAIAENAPAPSRVSGGPTPRPASEIAAELAASKARAIDPNVAARRASLSPTEQVAQIKRVNVSPDDQRILADFNDIANGVYKPDARLQRQIELDATRIAEKYNIPLRSTALETADEFDNFLQRGVTKPEFAPKLSRQTNQLAPKPSKTDPLEALKAEARKYKSADEFSRSYDAEELLYKKVASDISAQTPKELRVKPTSLGVLKGNLRGSWVDNGDAYTFYPKKSFSPDWEKELARVVPDAKVSSGAVDFPKSKYKSMNYEDLGTVYNQATKPKAYYQNAPKPSKQDPLEALKAEARQATGARSDYSPENLQANRQIRAKNASSITYADKKAIKPDELVTVYRAVPGKAKGGLTEGDWVTPNKEQARLFMKQSWAQDDTGAKIVTKKVKASELRYHADDAKGYVDDELLYVPKSDPLEALKQEARKYKSADEFVNSQVSRPKTTDNVWQDTLPSGTRPDSIKKVTKSGGNPLYHDTTADGVLGILDSGEIKASQAPFSSIAGQGKRVSTTRNFDNYSRYNKSPYRLVIDESKTGQRAIPDNREEFESIFRKGVSTKAVNSVAIDTTNPALLDDIRSGKLKSVIESAKKKGITVEPFEGKVLPNEGANAEVQTMTSRAFNEAFPEYKTRISQLTDLYNQATKPQIIKQEVPKSWTKPKTAFEQNTGVVAPTKKAKLELNTKRLNLTPEQTAQLDPKVKSVVDRMSNDDVVRIAKSAGLDTKSYSPGETRVKIAEQLNVRQDAVRLMNEAEVARKAGNTDQAAELLKQAAEQGRISRTQGTDLARQLQARRIIANELDTPQQKVFKLFDEAGVNPDVYTKRLAGVDFSDSKQVVNAYRELVPAKAGQWLDTVRYNSMLSSPLTQAVNIFGNAQNVAGVAPIEKTIRGGIDSIAGLFGKERQYAAGEGASYLKGEVKALPKAAKSFVDALKGSGEYANQDFSDYNMPLATKGAAGKAYQALSFPMRVLDGMDKFFRTLASSGEEAALDKRVSKGIGLRGDKQSLIDQEAAYRVYQAEGHIPGQGKVLDAMDSVADLVMSGRNSKNPILSTISKFTVPFVKTVNNINKQGFIEYSPAGLLNLVGKEDKIEGITKAVMGTAVFGTSALLLKSGDMTWAEPRNAEERARFRAEGKQPYAIKMGGKWYNYSKLTPVVAFPMAMTAALDDAFNKGKADQSFIDKTLTAFAKYGNFMSDQSYAKSIGDTLGAIGGDEEAIARMVSNQWQQVVPARALTGWLARMTDDVERKVDTTQGYFDQQVQAFMQQYPGLRQKTPTRDYQGQPIAANNPVLNAFSPVRVTNDRGVSPLDAEQDAIKLATAKAELLDKRQLKEVDNRSADKIREAQKQLISQPGWNELTAEEKKSGLSRLESDIKAVEKLQYQADNHVGEYSGSYTGKSTKLTANQKTLVNDGVRLSKYVGKSDSTEAKTNKEKYEKAFEDFNDPDNGYSRVEKVKKREELKRLTVQKDYDEDTTMLHGMSKEDVWGFLSTYEDGKAMADKLLALDDALTAAGVQDKNKFRDKYGNITIKPKEKSSGKGGSKAKTVKGQAEAVSSERKLRALLANTNNKTSYRKPATQSAKVGLKKFAVKSAGITSRKGA